MCRPRSSTAHLLLGLGGLGCRAVRRAAQVLAKRNPSGLPMPFRCLGVDTDRSVSGPVAETAYEGVLLSLEELRRARLCPADHPPVGEWLPPDLPEPGPEGGTGGCRALGRLAFFLSHRRLEQALARNLGQVCGGDPSHPLDAPAQRLRILIVSSASGGTGSGMLCDVAYLVHRLMDRVPLPSSCEALLLVPPGPDARLYASLTELNQWMAPDTAYSIRFCSGETWSTRRPPFERVHLVAGEHGRGLSVEFDQVTAHLGLSLWEGYTALGEELSRRQKLLAGTDGAGNPLSYCSTGIAGLSLPWGEIERALNARLAGRVEENRESQARQFLISQELTLPALKHRLREELTRADPGRFDVARRLGRLREELERKPVYAAELASRLTEWDRQWTAALSTCEEAGAGRHPARCRSERLRSRTRALQQRLSCFRPGWEEYGGFCRFLDQLQEQISDHLQCLYEELFRREAAALRLAKEKRAAIQEAARFDPGLLGRLVGRGMDGACSTVWKRLEEDHTNRREIRLDREALDFYLGLLDCLQQYSSGVNQLLEYFDRVESSLAEEEFAALERAFAVPGVVLLSRADVEKFLNHGSTEEKVARAAEELLESLGADLLCLPRSVPPGEMVARLLSRLERRTWEEPRAHLAGQFLARYPGEAAPDALRLLYGRARPSVAPAGSCDRAAYVGIYGGSEADDPSRSRLLQALFRIPLEEKPVVVPLSTGDRMVLVRTAGGFPLGALDLEASRKEYIHALSPEQPSLHTRRDVRWRALRRPHPGERRQIRRVLAAALCLGQLGELSAERAGERRVICSRWSDVGRANRCLALYEDPVEALMVESDLLARLRRWQNDRLERVGVEAYLQALKAPPEGMALFGDSYVEDLEAARQALQKELEDRWPEMEAALTRALAQSPSVSAADLVAIPPGLRQWAMVRYVEARPAEHLAYHAGSGRLELVSARELEHFERHWRAMVESLDRRPEAFGEHAGELIRFLCHGLGFQPGELLAQGPFRGMQVRLHGLRIKIPERVPILACRSPVIAEEDVGWLRTLLEQLGPDHRFALLLTAGDRDRNIQMVDEHLRRVLRYDVIILTGADLRQVLRVRDRLKALVARILEQVDLTVVSPFVTEGPVPASMFFGREGEIKEILQRLSRFSLAVVGPRRIGKTSVLQRVLASLRSRHRPVVWVDCQAVAHYRDFLGVLAAGYLPDRSHVPQESPMDLHPLLEDLRARYGDEPLVLIADEVDMLLREDREGSEALVRVLRTASQEGLVHCLFCGEKTLLARLKDPDSAFHNSFHTVRLDFLDPRDAARLVTEPMEQMEVRFEGSAALLDRILEITCSHPNLLQRMCSGIVERLNRERTRTIRAEHIEQVASDPKFVEEYLETLWGRSNEVERIVTLSLEAHEEVTPLELRRRLSAVHGVEVELPPLVESLETLELFGILEKRGSRYRFKARSFPPMVRSMLDVEDEIELYREMMVYGK